MQEKRPSLLVVDDEPSMRMVQILTENGYAARSATNGFSALVEICQVVPDFLVSDLSLPGNTGYEFLRVVRSQFPSIRVVAMSDAYSGSEVPWGASADAFFEKGTGVDALLSIIKLLPRPERRARQLVAASEPVWSSRSAGRGNQVSA
jgi:CheY-like chemotaxis protein